MEEKRDSHMKNARSAEQRGDCAAARAEALEAAGLDPLFAEAHLLLGRCSMKEDKPAEAAVSFSRVLELQPDSVEALTGASRAALLANDFSKAMEYVEKAEKAGGASYELNIIRAAILVKQRDYAAALPLFAKAVAENPDDEESVLGLASAYISTGEREKAAALLKESLERMPRSPAVLTLLLTLAVQDNNFEDAETYVQRLLTLRPEDPALALQLSDMRLLVGKEEESRSVLADYLQKYPAADPVRVRLAELDAAKENFDAALSVLEEAPVQTGFIRLTRASVLGRAGRVDEAEALLKQLAVDPSAKEQSMDARLGLVEIYLESRRMEDAEKELNLILADAPQNGDALFLRGRIYFTMGRFADAVADFSRVLEADETDLEAALALADAYNASRNPERAEEIISDVIRRSPKYGLAYTTLANLYMMRQQPEAALMTLGIGKKEVPQDPTLPVLEADILTSLKRFDDARAILEKLAEQKDFTEIALMRLAAVSGAAGEHDKAVAVYDRVLAENPDATAAAEGRIRALSLGKKEKEALAFAEKRQKERPDDPAAAYMTGEAALANKNYDKAEAAFLRALEIAPGWDQPLTLLAQYYSATNRIDMAMDLARKSMANAPESTGPAVVLAMLQEEKGALDDAEATYRSILANDPKTPVAANNLAFLITRHKPDPERLQEAEGLALIASATGAPATLDTLGWVRFLRGNDEGAEEALRQAHQGMPDNPVIVFHLASVLAALGKNETGDGALAKKDEARVLLKGILDSKADFPQKAEAKKLHDSLK